MSNVRPMYQMPAYNPPALPLQNTKVYKKYN